MKNPRRDRLNQLRNIFYSDSDSSLFVSSVKDAVGGVRIAPAAMATLRVALVRLILLTSLGLPRVGRGRGSGGSCGSRSGLLECVHVAGSDDQDRG